MNTFGGNIYFAGDGTYAELNKYRLENLLSDLRSLKKNWQFFHKKCWNEIWGGIVLRICFNCQSKEYIQFLYIKKELIFFPCSYGTSLVHLKLTSQSLSWSSSSSAKSDTSASFWWLKIRAILVSKIWTQLGYLWSKIWHQLWRERNSRKKIRWQWNFTLSKIFRQKNKILEKCLQLYTDMKNFKW